MCNNCIHKAVCSIYRATGGVKKCEHFKEGRRGKLCPLDPMCATLILVDSECPFCRASMLKTDKFCPMCGADMRPTEGEDVQA